MLEKVRRFLERTRRNYAPVWQAWREWQAATREDAEMLGYGWGYWLVFTVGMVLATFVVGLGIVTGAVAILMQAWKEVRGG